MKTYNDNVDHNKVVLSNYYKVEYDNNKIKKLYKYSTKMKLKMVLNYFYDDKNNLIKIEYTKLVGEKYKIYKVLLYKYKYGFFNNPVSKKTYELVGKKIEKFVDEEEYRYEYY